jgi:hypothetical protein
MPWVSLDPVSISTLMWRPWKRAGRSREAITEGSCRGAPSPPYLAVSKPKTSVQAATAVPAGVAGRFPPVPRDGGPRHRDAQPAPAPGGPRVESVVGEGSRSSVAALDPKARGVRSGVSGGQASTLRSSSGLHPVFLPPRRAGIRFPGNHAGRIRVAGGAWRDGLHDSRSGLHASWARQIRGSVWRIEPGVCPCLPRSGRSMLPLLETVSLTLGE